MRRSPHPVQRRVLRSIREHQMFEARRTVVVGVSGGPDSVCLLHVLASLKRNLRVTLHVAHLNHMLRGAESDADAAFVRDIARKLRVPVTIGRQDVEAYRSERRLTLEEAAREIRYAFLARVARSQDSNTIALGHTADDQVETVLMHLIRGSGLTGLRGMRPLTIRRIAGYGSIRVARPLLDVTKDEALAYCAAQGLSARTDSSNLEQGYFRNRLRARLIPLLREFNPEIEDTVLRVARSASADLSYIEEEVSRVWDAIAAAQDDRIAIDKASFASLHPSLKRHLVRSAFQRMLGDVQDVESTHIESVVDALSRRAAGKRLSLPRGLSFYSDYSHGYVAAKEYDDCPFPTLEGERRLNLPGETHVGTWRVETAFLDGRPAYPEKNRFEAYVDFDVAGRELLVRGRKRGDRFQPLGMEDTKKLQDFMVDARIPGQWRDRIPLVCSPDHILWVVGWRIDHRARVTESTRRVLHIRFEPS